MSDEAVQGAEAAEEGQQAAEESKQETPAPATETPAPAETVPAPEPPAPAAAHEDVSYQAVEKEGVVTAIWEMQGQKHLRTIDPRSIEGKQILALFETAG
jgi:3-oxoacyl-ACP reductase-like protein